MSQTSRNYHGEGGNSWVIGGTLTFLPGATVEGAEGLLELPRLPSLPPSEATTVAALREELNALIEALKDAGLMAQDEPERP